MLKDSSSSRKGRLSCSKTVPFCTVQVELEAQTAARAAADAASAELQRHIDRLEAELRRRPPLAGNKIQRSPRRRGSDRGGH